MWVTYVVVRLCACACGVQNSGRGVGTWDVLQVRCGAVVRGTTRVIVVISAVVHVSRLPVTVIDLFPTSSGRTLFQLRDGGPNLALLVSLVVLEARREQVLASTQR